MAHPRVRRLGQSPVPCRGTCILVALVCMTISISCHRKVRRECEICDAARKGDLDKVEALVRTDPKQVFRRDDKGNTPLHVSASHGYLDITKLLLANKADVN